jgi:hypothetical protein
MKFYLGLAAFAVVSLAAMCWLLGELVLAVAGGV